MGKYVLRRLLQMIPVVLGVTILVFTIMFIPGRTLFEAANRGIAAYGLKLEAVSLGKTLPFGISGKGITLSSESGELLRIRSGRLALEILPLLAGEIALSAHAEIGSGSLDASMSLLRSPSTKITVKNIRLEDIPFFQTVAGVRSPRRSAGSVSPP